MMSVRSTHRVAKLQWVGVGSMDWAARNPDVDMQQTCRTTVDLNSNGLCTTRLK